MKHNSKTNSIPKKKSKKASAKIKAVPFDKRCIVCSDLDGTLLDNKGMISHATREAIKRLTKQGHLFCILTARPKRSSIFFYKLLNLKTPLCNYNGSCINNPSDKFFDPIHLCINKELVKKIFSNPNIQKMIIGVVIETVSKTYFYNPQNYPIDLIRAQLAKFNIYTSDNITFLDKNFSQLTHGSFSILTSMADKYTLDDLKKEIHKICNTLIVRTWTEEHIGTIIEINSNFPSKGAALKYILSYYDIPPERCYAFGDNENDKEMLLVAGNSYAMKNGNDIAKKAAKHITRYANCDEGVAVELNEIFNLGLTVNDIKFNIKEAIEQVKNIYR